MLDTYIEWCETTDEVAGAYQRWCVAPAGEGIQRFAAYMAAVDQEESAAAVYAEAISELERWLQDSDSDPGPEPTATLG